MVQDFDGAHMSSAPQGGRVAVEDEAPAEFGQRRPEAQPTCADSAGALLLVLADALDDVERTRIANENRLRSSPRRRDSRTPIWPPSLAGIVTDLEAIERDK